MDGSKTEVVGVAAVAGVNQVVLFGSYPNSFAEGVWQLGTFLKGNFSISSDESFVRGIFRVKLMIL